MEDKLENKVCNDVASGDAVFPVNTEQLSVIKRAKVSESLQLPTNEQNRLKLESLALLKQ